MSQEHIAPKWAVALPAIVAVAICMVVAVDSYLVNKCRIAGLQANKTAEEINQLCKKIL